MPLVVSKANPGFFYHVTDPEQPLTTTYTLPHAYGFAPVAYNAFPLVHHYLSPCKNYLGLPVPCNLGGASVVVPAAAPPAAVEEPEVMAEDKGTIIDARRKREAESDANAEADADPDPESYYLGYGYHGYGGYGYGGYYPYGYGYGYGGHYPYHRYSYAHPHLYHGYRVGCTNYLGYAVPCAHGRR